MAQVPSTPTHTSAKRRSQRVLMQVGIRIRGKDAQGKEFEEFTQTLAINAHGALVLLTARLISGAVVHLRHNKTEEDRSATWRFSALSAAAKPRLVWSFQHHAPPSGAWRFLPKTGHRSLPKPARFPPIAR